MISETLVVTIWYQKHWLLQYFSVFNIFLFSVCWTASFKTSKNLVNYAILCYDMNKNIVNTSIFWFWLKKYCKLQGFWPPDPQKPWYFCFLPRKNTLNNSKQQFRLFFHDFHYFLNCIGPLYMAIKFSDVFNFNGRHHLQLRAVAKVWEHHRASAQGGSCRGATAIEKNNGNRREQWLTSLRVWTVHSIYIYMVFIYIYIYR